MKNRLADFAEKKIDASIKKFGHRTVLCWINSGMALTLLGVTTLDAFDWFRMHDSQPFFLSLFALPIGYYIGDSLAARRCRNRQDLQQETNPTLPAKYLFCILLPKKVREPLIGDMEEEYREIWSKYGKRAATLCFCRQVLMLLRPMLQMIGRLLIAEFIRRIAH